MPVLFIFVAIFYMPTTGPIVIVEDDLEDQDVIGHVFSEINVTNELKFFAKSSDALEFLRTTGKQPFLILCDVNMPEMNGLELRRQLCETDYLKERSIPFVFLSTSVRTEDVKQAFDLMAQGFFKKAENYAALKKDLQAIVEYWMNCRRPIVN